MTSLSTSRSSLFADKGQAMPACSKPLTRGTAERPPRDVPAAVTRPNAAPQDEGPASVLTIDLRRALVPDRSATPEAASPAPIPAPTPAPPSPAQVTGMAGPLIAAVVAVSIAAGVFYVFEQDRFHGPAGGGDAGAASAEAAKPDGPAASADAAMTDAAMPDVTSSTAPIEESAEAATTPETTPETTSDPEAGSGKLPSFDLVRVEPDGSAVIAGRAAPHADLVLLHNGKPIGTAKADWAGEWAFVTDAPLPADRHQITILVNDPDAEITLPEGAEPPAQLGSTQSPPR